MTCLLKKMDLMCPPSYYQMDARLNRDSVGRQCAKVPLRCGAEKSVRLAWMETTKRGRAEAALPTEARTDSDVSDQAFL